MNLFRHNMLMKARSAYTGSWMKASKLFDLYDILIDIRGYTSGEKEGLYELRRDIYNEWKNILIEHHSHIEVNEDLADKISVMLRQINNFYKKNYSSTASLITLARMSKYKQLVQDFILYTQDFLKQIGIKTQVVKLRSDSSGLIVYAITPDLTESESYVSDQIDMNNVFKQKMFKQFLKEIKKKEYVIKDAGEYLIVVNRWKDEIIGYVTEDKFDKIYPTLEELSQSLEEKAIIENNYDKVVLGQEGQLLNQNGEVLTTLHYLNPKTLVSEIKKYNQSIEEYNANLKPYEIKLNNEPKIIQLGDLELKVVKVYYKNMNRPVIIEGAYKGLFLDQIVSSTGKILGSNAKASPYFITNRKVFDALGDTSKNVKKKETLDIERNIVTKKIQQYEREKGYYDYQYERDLKSSIPNKKVRDLIPTLTGMDIINDFSSELPVDIEVYGEFIKHNCRIGDTIEIDRSIVFKDGDPDYISNDFFKLHPCLPDGLGTKIFTQQVKSASSSGFKKIITTAARNLELVGYYVWPKLGYNGDIAEKMRLIKTRLTNNSQDKELEKLSQIETWFQNTLNHSVLDECMATDLYACKVGDRFLGQEFWKKHGSEVKLSFDLTDGSISMRILGAYLTRKAKSLGIPVEEFLNTDIQKYKKKTTNLECLVRNWDGGRSEALFYALEIALKNQENGEIIRILNSDDEDLKNPLIDYLFFLKTSKNKWEKDVAYAVRNLARINKSKSFENMRFASSNQSDDPIFRELDMEILNDVWEEISNDYSMGKTI